MKSVLSDVLNSLLSCVQSIIEEEGVGLTAGASTAEEQKSWDQPLIIAEPDVEVSSRHSYNNF